jgi:hypothetical protein
VTQEPQHDPSPNAAPCCWVSFVNPTYELVTRFESDSLHASIEIYPLICAIDVRTRLAPPIFFMVNLTDRSSTLLVDAVDVLRGAVRLIQQRHPFHIDAMVVLPDHLHAIWTLPEGDARFPQRWALIKADFSRKQA